MRFANPKGLALLGNMRSPTGETGGYYIKFWGKVKEKIAVLCMQLQTFLIEFSHKQD
jgi:hypothetical protein